MRADIKDGVDFEYYVQDIFLADGIHAVTTPTTNDYGSDLIVEYRGYTFSIQCKYYTSTVGVKAIQEVLGSLKYYSADYGVVITNSIFTQQAQNLADTNNVLLIGSDNSFESFKPAFDDFIEHLKGGRPTYHKSEEWTMEDLVIRYGVSRATLLKDFLGQGLPYDKVGREFRFDKEAITAWEIEQREITYGKDQEMTLPGYTEYVQKMRKELRIARKAKNHARKRAIKKDLKEHGVNLYFSRAWLLFVAILAVAALVAVVFAIRK